jgi:hypothetical protein
MAKGNREPVTDVTLENCCREREREWSMTFYLEAEISKGFGNQNEICVRCERSRCAFYSIMN